MSSSMYRNHFLQLFDLKSARTVSILRRNINVIHINLSRVYIIEYSFPYLIFDVFRCNYCTSLRCVSSIRLKHNFCSIGDTSATKTQWAENRLLPMTKTLSSEDSLTRILWRRMRKCSRKLNIPLLCLFFLLQIPRISGTVSLGHVSPHWIALDKLNKIEMSLRLFLHVALRICLMALSFVILQFWSCIVGQGLDDILSARLDLKFVSNKNKSAILSFNGTVTLSFYINSFSVSGDTHKHACLSSQHWHRQFVEHLSRSGGATMCVIPRNWL